MITATGSAAVAVFICAKLGCESRCALAGKHVSDSQVTLAQFMQPEHANVMGNVHGGWLMKLIDEAGGICAARHARRPTVTVAVDSL